MAEGPAALDAAALELLEALERLQEKRGLLGDLLRQGWFSLSQARYSLGCHRVSSLQYGAAMVPRVRVRPRQDPGGPLRFEEVPGTGEDPQELRREGDSELRQRRPPPKTEGAAPRPKPPVDPLTWFGVLVPPSLRQAQGSFCQAVSLALEVAELQGQVAAAIAHYRHLLASGGTAGDSSESPGGREPVDATQPLGAGEAAGQAGAAT
ncbi:coiled-coil domain-containing protein 115 [Melanerpes formicivorus]|uniref:coiled-coil domain-containing protein 115 n=1 Tax=Melanerpes formicivorus TaxID=211600 RepID=UPI00359024A9